MRQDFVANVSHELKTPLTVIRGFTETLTDDPDIDPDTRQRFLGRVTEQTLRLSSLVGDLLSLARLENEPAPQLTSMDLRGPVRETVDSLRSNAEARALSIDLELPPAPVAARLEQETLHTALVNLLDNAIKYSPEGATVEVSLEARGERAVIEVHDRGPGIPHDMQDRIFERFFRVDKARSRELGGTGLGLAIAKHAMRLLGGEISVTSTPGEGSTFRLELAAASLIDPSPEKDDEMTSRPVTAGNRES
jgi:two-component system phosphate regulon sensor histidine kinase PhoR